MRVSLTTNRVVAILLFFGSSLTLHAGGRNPAAQSDVSETKAVIFGQATDQDGKPAIGIRLVASPLGKVLATALPWVITDQEGRFRFEHLFGWGKYTVYADDPAAGFSDYSQDPDYRASPLAVMLSAEHSQAQFNFRLPPRAGFLYFHLTNQKTREAIDDVEVDVFLAGGPQKWVFSDGQGTDKPVLVPPNRDLLIHVKSSGYREWYVSAGKGKPIHLAPGERMDLDIALEPVSVEDSGAK